MNRLQSIINKNMAGNQIFVMAITLIVLFVYTNAFLKHGSLINELTLLYTSESNKTVVHIMEILTSMEFNIITRFVSIFSVLYIVSFLLWLISRFDLAFFNPNQHLTLNFFTKSYLYSLYISILDFICQTIYMTFTKQDIPLHILPYYMVIFITLQCIVILYNLKIRENKLYITAAFFSLLIIALDIAIIYIGSVYQ